MKPAPSYKNYPARLNPSAMDVWRHTVKKYADSIYESKDLEEQWKTAKNNFERLCKIKGLTPYVDPLEALARRIERIAKRL